MISYNCHMITWYIKVATPSQKSMVLYFVWTIILLIFSILSITNIYWMLLRQKCTHVLSNIREFNRVSTTK